MLLAVTHMRSCRVHLESALVLLCFWKLDVMGLQFGSSVVRDVDNCGSWYHNSLTIFLAPQMSCVRRLLWHAMSISSSSGRSDSRDGMRIDSWHVSIDALRRVYWGTTTTWDKNEKLESIKSHLCSRYVECPRCPSFFLSHGFNNIIKPYVL